MIQIFRSRSFLISKNSILFTNIYFVKSEQKLNKQNRAKAALQTINFITSLHKNPKRFTITQTYEDAFTQESQKTSLAQQIIQNLKEKQFNQQTLKFFRQLFDPTKGIILPHHLSTQQRITNAAIIDQNNQYKKRFSFFPNRLVTIPIFYQLQTFDSKTLLYGAPGISKTSSIIFYCYLLHLINQFQFEQNQMIAPQIKRIIYISYFPSIDYKNINLMAQNDDDYINDMIELQIQHITGCLISNCPGFIDQKLKAIKGKKKIRLFYKSIHQQFKKRNIQFKVISDQFNAFVSFCMFINELIERLKDNQQSVENNQELKILKKIFLFEKQIWFTLAHKYAKYRYLLNNSQNIQDYMLSFAKEPFIGLQINNHQNILLKYVDYFQKIKSNNGQKQVIRMMFDQIKRTINGYLTQINKIKNIENNIMNNDDIFKMMQPIYLTPLQLRLSCQNKKKHILNILQKCDKQKSGQTLKKLLRLIENDIYESAKVRSKKFCEQGTEKESFNKLITLYLIRQLIIQKKVLENDNQFYTITQKAFPNSKFVLKKQMVDKNLFQIDYYESNKLSLTIKFPKQGFLSITSFADEKFMKYLINGGNLQLLFLLCGENNSIIGILLEGIYRYLLTNYYCKIRIKQTGRQNFHFPTYFQINKITNIKHFNSQLQVKPLQIRLKQLITGFVCALATPITNDNTDSVNSHSFDFIISKMDRPQSQKYKYIIYSFDLTVSVQQNNINQKIKSFKKLINKIFQNYDNNLIKTQPKDLKITQWSHVIIGNYQNKLEFFQVPIGKEQSKITAKCKLETIRFQDFQFEQIQKVFPDQQKLDIQKLKSMMGKLIEKSRKKEIIN